MLTDHVCANCKHHLVGALDFHLCMRPRVDLVTGKLREDGAACYSERTVSGECGIVGAFFERVE